MSAPSTVRPAGSRRRVVHRRPALDQAWATVLAELPPGMHPAMRAYIEARRAEYEARLALGTALTQNGLRWSAVDRLAHKLTYTSI